MAFNKVALAAFICMGISAGGAQASVVLAGNATSNIATSLNALGVTFTNIGTTMPTSLGAGTTLILSYDGGYGPYQNYTSALNTGADVIVFGGSCDGGGWSSWTGLYINNSGGCWHTDGANGSWNTVANNAATQFLPSYYNPINNSLTYHVEHLFATPDTVLLGANSEGNAIAAFRTYANGGSFNYLAMDPGPYGTAEDINNFTVKYLQGAMLAAQNGLSNQVPEPGSLALMGLGLIGLMGYRRKNKPN
ncbi:MAG: hypothetical protein FD131_4704 [Rhodocyclaceae bacterium]|nr:MAG: hypothetical protein FD131_4704 [Rhodocyclaceae bacterium]